MGMAGKYLDQAIVENIVRLQGIEQKQKMCKLIKTNITKTKNMKAITILRRAGWHIWQYYLLQSSLSTAFIIYDLSV